MDEPDPYLNAALRELAHDEIGLGASLRVEADLRAHVRALRAPITSRRPPAWRSYLAAAAAAVLFAAVWRFVPSEAPSPASTIATDATQDSAADAGFLPLPYAHVPTSGGQIVRMSVPRESLASFGLEPGNPGGPDAVLADVFVGTDGIARAVRFVGPDIQEESRP